MDKKAYSVKKEYIDIAQKYKASLIELGIPVEQIVLFGSRVTGKEHKWSDLDICVVSPMFGVDRLAERVLLMGIGNEVNNLIEPHPFSPESINEKYDPVATQIRNTGIIV